MEMESVKNILRQKSTQKFMPMRSSVITLNTLRLEKNFLVNICICLFKRIKIKYLLSFKYPHGKLVNRHEMENLSLF